MEITLDTVEDWLNELYNDGLSTYRHQDGDSAYVRLTNGSAAYYIDIYIHGDSFVLEGEQYGEVVNTSCDKTRDALVEILSTII